MKILLVSNLYPPQIIGGYEVLAFQMAEKLRARGHNVQVLTSNAVVRPDLLGDASHVHPRLRMVEATFSDNSGDYRFQAHVWQRFNNEVLHRAIQEFTPDVAYLWNTEGIGTFGILHTLVQSGVPIVWHLQDSVPHKAIESAGPHASLVANFFAQEKSLRVISVSKTLTEEITSFGVRFAHPITEIRNWIIEDARVRTDFWSPERPLRILFAGQLAPHKGFDFAIEALTSLNKSGFTNFTFSLVGNPTKHVESGLARAHENGWGEKVEFVGPKTMREMTGVYLNHDLFLFPTWSRDPMPIVVLESSAAGCVPMLSEYCGTAEWVEDGIDSILVERDSEAITKAIKRIFDEPHYLEAIARFGLANTAKNFSIDAPLSLVEGLLSSAERAPAGDFYATSASLEKLLFGSGEVANSSQRRLTVKRLLRRALTGGKLKFVIWVDGLPWLRSISRVRESNRKNFPKH